MEEDNKEEVEEKELEQKEGDGGIVKGTGDGGRRG